MDGCAVMSARESILQPQFVKADYFLCKVRDFELKYNASWGQFLAEFSSGLRDRDNSDFIEWAFLCRTFLAELIEQESPPGRLVELSQEPESNSGFCFCGGYVCPSSMQSTISTALTGHCIPVEMPCKN
jgi:hypothetical protein